MVEVFTWRSILRKALEIQPPLHLLLVENAALAFGSDEDNSAGGSYMRAERAFLVGKGGLTYPGNYLKYLSIFHSFLYLLLG